MKSDNHSSKHSITVDVLIIGAGPAGLSAARILAENNRSVIVLEKNKTLGKKVCAGGLTAKDLDYIPKEIVERKFNKFCLVLRNEKQTNKKYETLRMNTKNHRIVTIDRQKLGRYLAKKAEDSGAKILLNSEMVQIKDNFVLCKTKKSGIIDHKKIFFKNLIGADGSLSIVRKHLGLSSNKIWHTIQYKVKNNAVKYQAQDLEVIIDPEKFGYSFAWIFPHKKYTYVGTGGPIAALKEKNMGELKTNLGILCAERCFKNKKFESSIINCDYKGHEFAINYSDNRKIFLAGDAGGFASELTGEGIYSAIISGQEIAKKIINPEYNCKPIKDILRTKKRHTFLAGCASSKMLSRFMLTGLLPFLFKNKSIARKFNQIFNMV